MFRNLNLRSDFFRSVMVLTSGTVIAQVLSYAVTPLITRLFTPEDFGEIGVFMRIVSFLAAIGTARYELTLPLPKYQGHAFLLFRLSVRIALWMVLLIIGGGLLYWLFTGLKNYTLFYFIMIAGATFFAVFKNIGTNWAIRTKAFKRISSSNILTAVSTNGLKLIAGLYGFGVPGLIIATVIGSLVGAVVYLTDYLKNKKKKIFERSDKRIYALSRQYREFPRVNLPHTLLDGARELLIAFFVVEIFSRSFFGSYDLSFRMLKLPLVLVGVSLGQVFYNKCSVLYANREALFPFLKRTTLLLTVISVIPFTIIFLFGEPIFIWVFGEKWGLAGKISEILSPWLMVNFIASPISTLPMIIGRQVLFFWLGLISTAIQLIGFGFVPLVIFDGSIDELILIRWISYTMTAYLVIVTVIKLKITVDSDQKRVVT
ncbi:MAG: oligosaccharide flippase family protein [Brumimicrobium sp.]|nr:oligosaccharide flippase family protein [Brumimicrobium sp.]